MPSLKLHSKKKLQIIEEEELYQYVYLSQSDLIL